MYPFRFEGRMRKRHVSRRILSYGLSGSWRGVLGGVCLATAAAGCAVNPVSGRTEMAVLSAEKERELGDEEAK